MQTPTWICADGTPVYLSAMSSLHIRNVLSYIERGTGEFGDLSRPGCNGFTNAEWMLLCRAELIRRSRRTKQGDAT
jgi:hypothetical protein